MTEPEAEAVAEMLQKCENPPDVEGEFWEALGTATWEYKPEPELQNSVYGSCEDPEAAGRREARAVDVGSRRRWSRPRGMGMGTGTV